MGRSLCDWPSRSNRIGEIMQFHQSLSCPESSGLIIVPYIHTAWIPMLSPSRIGFKDSYITSLSGKGWHVASFDQYSLDVDLSDSPKRILNHIKDFQHIMGCLFPWLKPGKIGSYASGLAGSAAKRTRPQFQRRPEIEAHKAFFGGRSEIFEPDGQGHLVEYDLPRSYPMEALKPLPVDAPFFVPANSEPSQGFTDLCKIRLVFYNDIGPLAIRTQQELTFPKEGKIQGWYWLEEINQILEYCETIRDFQILERIRVRTDNILEETMETLIVSRKRYPQHEKSFKHIANSIIGFFAYKGRTKKVFYDHVGNKLKAGDCLLCPELRLWGRAIPNKKAPHTYRPMISSLIWARARAKLFKALCTTENPVSCHIDGVTAHKQNILPLGTIQKKDYGMVSFNCPWRGALLVDNKRIRLPGKRKG